MIRRADIPGVSGQVYAFTELEVDQPLRQVGVTWLIATPAKFGWRVLQAGETNNLGDRSWAAALALARAKDPLAACLIRLNVRRTVREAELSDIRQVQGHLIS